MPIRTRIGARRESEGIHEPNMTPLIDVSLVLVVILMVATPLAFQSSIAVNTANRSARAAAERVRTTRVEIDVLADGRVQVNRAIVPREALAATLTPLLQGDQASLVVVRCDDTVTHGAFVSVIDEARTLGATRIAVIGG